MKKIILGMLFIAKLAAAPECLDNSYHLTQLDHKNYHPVACNCPCGTQYKILARRGTCIKCGHYRDPYANKALSTYVPVTICLTKQIVKKS